MQPFGLYARISMRPLASDLAAHSERFRTSATGRALSSEPGPACSKPSHLSGSSVTHVVAATRRYQHGRAASRLLPSNVSHSTYEAAASPRRPQQPARENLHDDPGKS